jgi:hypothetical protein
VVHATFLFESHNHIIPALIHATEEPCIHSMIALDNALYWSAAVGEPLLYAKVCSAKLYNNGYVTLQLRQPLQQRQWV